MVNKYRYEFIVDGEVKDRITCDSMEELKKCMDVLKKWEDKTQPKKESKR